MTNTFSLSLGTSWYWLVPLYTNFASICSVVLWLRQICKLKLLQSVNFCKSVFLDYLCISYATFFLCSKRTQSYCQMITLRVRPYQSFQKELHGDSWWNSPSTSRCLPFFIENNNIKKSWRVTDDEQVAFSVGTEMYISCPTWYSL